MNGDARDKCKYCEHIRCDAPVTKVIPYRKDDKVILQKVKVPEEEKSKLN